MKDRIKDKRYKEGVDRGRMATQNITLPVKKDFKPQKKVTPNIINNENFTIISFEDLPKQIQRHVIAKLNFNNKKSQKKQIMKKFLLAIILFAAIQTNAQSFLGVPISGHVSTAIANFKAKGFKFVKQEKYSVTMSGVIDYTPVELYIYNTPTTKQTAKFVVYYPERNSWLSLKDDYDRFVSRLSDKYGSPDKTIEEFITPYESGDGYELSAIQLEKAVFLSYWFAGGYQRSNLSIAVEISKFKQLKVVYENDKIMDKLAEERKVLDYSNY